MTGRVKTVIKLDLIKETKCSSVTRAFLLIILNNKIGTVKISRL